MVEIERKQVTHREWTRQPYSFSADLILHRYEGSATCCSLPFLRNKEYVCISALENYTAIGTRGGGDALNSSCGPRAQLTWHLPNSLLILRIVCKTMLLSFQLSNVAAALFLQGLVSTQRTEFTPPDCGLLPKGVKHLSSFGQKSAAFEILSCLSIL